MNIIQQVEKLISTSTREQMDALYRAASFDVFQKEGCEILSPDQALALAGETSYEASLINTVASKPDTAWETPKQGIAAGTFEEMPLAA